MAYRFVILNAVKNPEGLNEVNPLLSALWLELLRCAQDDNKAIQQINKARAFARRAKH